MNHAVLQHLQPDEVEVEICRADELEVRRGLSSELDEMWSFVKAYSSAEIHWFESGSPLGIPCSHQHLE